MNVRCVAVLLTLAGVLAAPAAWAGNRSTYLIGGRAAGMGGAFTALANDASAAWYNPAGLTAWNRDSFDLSATAYGMEFLEAPDLVEMQRDRHYGREYSVSAINIVATSFDTVFRLSDADDEYRHVLALSVLIPQQRDLSQSYDLNSDDGLFRQKFTLEEKLTRYMIGPSYGVRVAEYLSLGLSLFVVYDQHKQAFQFYVHSERGPHDEHQLFNSRLDGQVFGLSAAVAAQFHWAGWRVGLQVRSPVMRVYSDWSGQDQAVFALDQYCFEEDGQRKCESGGTDLKDPNYEETRWGFETASP